MSTFQGRARLFVALGSTCFLLYATPSKASPIAWADSLKISPANEGVKRVIIPPKGHPTIALALGGGGLRGAAHIGVLRVFEREHIPIDYIAGCSMGSIVGGLYAAGVTIEEIEATFADGSLQKSFAPGTVGGHIFALYLADHLPFRVKPYAGLYNGKKFLKFLNKQLPQNTENIQDTKIPFVAVVTNLCDGKAYKLAEGDLAHAILASSALPPLVRPVYLKGNLYIDGGVRSNVPVVSAKQFNPDLTIAISVDETLNDMECQRFTSLSTVANRVTSVALSVEDAYHCQKADLVIRPDVNGISLFSRKNKDAQIAIRAGEQAAQAALPQIREAIAACREKAHMASTALNTEVK